MQYDPNSLDSRITEILTLVKEQKDRFKEKCDADKIAFDAIMAKQDKTNGRVNKLEEFMASVKGKVALISFSVPIFVSIVGWAVSKL